MDVVTLPEVRPTRVRYLIIAILFAVSCFSFGDRVALSLAGAAMAKVINLNSREVGLSLLRIQLGLCVGTTALRRFARSLRIESVYGISIILWSICAFLTGFAGYLAASAAFTAIFVLRLFSGLAQAPVFPGNGRIVAAWFPNTERGRASAIFNSAQYFALLIFAPIFGWIIHDYGWQSCFWFMGVLGFALAFVWFTNIYGVKEHPRISQAEIATIELGGGLVNSDHRNMR